MALEVHSAGFNLRLDVLERKTDVGFANNPPSRKPHLVEYVAEFVGGTGINKVGAVYSSRETLSAPLDLDLSGSLTSVLDGSVVSFPLLMGIVVINRSTTSGEAVDVGGGDDGSGSNAVINWISTAAGKRRIGPGGLMIAWDPIDAYAVTAATADILRLAAVSGSPVVDVLLLGRAS